MGEPGRRVSTPIAVIQQVAHEAGKEPCSFCARMPSAALDGALIKVISL
jgi:hypothetical protein